MVSRYKLAPRNDRSLAIPQQPDVNRPGHAYQHLHGFPRFVSSYFTSSLVVFLVNVKCACRPVVGDTGDTENDERWGLRSNRCNMVWSSGWALRFSSVALSLPDPKAYDVVHGSDGWR